jgi:hypothetical protein
MNITLTSIANIIPEMQAQVAREIPDTAPDFEAARLTRLFDLAKEIQDYLNTCEDEFERSLVVAEYLAQSAERELAASKIATR